MRVAFLCSGGGGNLRFVAHAIRQQWLPGAEVCAVWADRECGASRYARLQGFPTQVLDFAAPAQAQLIDKLWALAPDVVVTTVHRVLVPGLVEVFESRLVNVHYSLLPAFAGLVGVRPVEQALAHGARWLGVTVHHLDEQLDHGRPIVQAVTSTPQAPQLDTVMNVLFRAGCVGLLHGVATVGGVSLPGQEQELATLAGRRVWFSPSVVVPPSLEDDRGWGFLND